MRASPPLTSRREPARRLPARAASPIGGGRGSGCSARGTGSRRTWPRKLAVAADQRITWWARELKKAGLNRHWITSQNSSWWLSITVPAVDARGKSDSFGVMRFHDIKLIT